MEKTQSQEGKVSHAKSHSSHVWVCRFKPRSTWSHPECVGFTTNLPSNQALNYCSRYHLGSFHKFQCPGYTCHHKFLDWDPDILKIFKFPRWIQCVGQVWEQSCISHEQKFVALNFVFYIILSQRISYDLF